MFRKNLFLVFLSAGVWARYSVATKTRVTKGTGSSPLHSLYVRTERGGGEISFHFRKAIDF